MHWCNSLQCIRLYGTHRMHDVFWTNARISEKAQNPISKLFGTTGRHRPLITPFLALLAIMYSSLYFAIGSDSCRRASSQMKSKLRVSCLISLVDTPFSSWIFVGEKVANKTCHEVPKTMKIMGFGWGWSGWSSMAHGMQPWWSDWYLLWIVPGYIPPPF